MAVGFLDAECRCRLVWLNKGPNHRRVPLVLSQDEVVTTAKNKGARFVLLAHNHPISSFDRPNYKTRRMNIQASRALKRAQSRFSEADDAFGAAIRLRLEAEGIGLAEAVIIAGTAVLRGDEQVIQNYQAHKPAVCFVATAAFGESAWETSALRAFRDSYLLEHTWGAAFCRLNYMLSPSVAGWIEQHAGLRLCARVVLRLLARLAVC